MANSSFRRKVGQHDLKGLKSFAEFYDKKHQAIVVYLGENNLEIDGIRIYNLVSALKALGY